MPCGKYLVVMRDLWLPLLAKAGDLNKPALRSVHGNAEGWACQLFGVGRFDAAKYSTAICVSFVSIFYFKGQR